MAKTSKEKKGENAMSIQSQVRKFVSVVSENLPDLQEEIMQSWIENPRGLQEALREALVLAKNDEKMIWSSAQEKAYNLLGFKKEYRQFLQEQGEPKEVPDYWQLVVVKGLTCNKVVATLRQEGVDVYSYYENLDEEVAYSDRDPNKDGSYTIMFRAAVEADEDNKNLSANDCQERGIKGITLLERLLMEMVYFLMTREHLDIKNVTICTGSSDRRGCAPGVGWLPGGRGVVVGWFLSGARVGDLRARSAVSSPAKQA